MTQGRKKTGGEMLAQAASEYIETHYKEKFSLQKMAGDLYVNGSSGKNKEYTCLMLTC